MGSSNLKWVTQVDKVCSNNFDAELVRLLYVSLVRPHLKFAVPVWNSYIKNDIEKLEDIQHKVTKLVPTLKKKRIWV